MLFVIRFDATEVFRVIGNNILIVILSHLQFSHN